MRSLCFSKNPCAIPSVGKARNLCLDVSLHITTFHPTKQIVYLRSLFVQSGFQFPQFSQVLFLNNSSLIMASRLGGRLSRNNFSSSSSRVGTLFSSASSQFSSLFNTIFQSIISQVNQVSLWITLVISNKKKIKN